jgi:hypothetical protein
MDKLYDIIRGLYRETPGIGGINFFMLGATPQPGFESKMTREIWDFMLTHPSEIQLTSINTMIYINRTADN